MNGHQIPLADATVMTARYRNNIDQILTPTAVATNALPTCETFNKEAVLALLNVQGCAFFRIYYGMSDDLQVHAILVAADIKGQDILPVGNGGDGDGQILEDAARCPTDCPPPSPLNATL